MASVFTAIWAAVTGIAVGLAFVPATAADTAQPGPLPRITHLESGVSLPFPGHATRQVVRPRDTPSGLSMLELTLAPRSLGAPPHTHRDEDEYFVVMEGAVMFLNGAEERAAPAGTVAILPRGHRHRFWNPHEQPARLLLMVAPGHFESFFDDVVIRIREENADTPERIGAILGREAAARNVRIEMEHLPVSAHGLRGAPALPGSGLSGR